MLFFFVEGNWSWENHFATLEELFCNWPGDAINRLRFWRSLPDFRLDATGSLRGKFHIVPWLSFCGQG